MTPPATNSSDVLPYLSGYTIIEQLYAGSRTLVYRAVETSNQYPVIVKLLQQNYPNFNDLLQFRNQYTIAKNLDIPGIVRPYSLEFWDNSYALVMEDFGGISLRQYSQEHSLSLLNTLEIALQLAGILHELNQARVIHKDIKPANILIHPESGQVKLIDFSIASLLPKETPEIKNPSGLEGTLAYLAPEQTGRMNRGIDYRADFYALGVMLFELLTGQLPFQSSDPMELVHCHLAKQPPSVISYQLSAISEKIPQVISEIVMKLMEKNAEDRYQSALGLQYDLQICLNQLKETGKIEPFTIGTRDVCDRFLIPEKLYGREVEVQMLLYAFDRIANGTSELMLVAGFSGIGKTAVVNEVHKPIVRERGYFIKGKFDQFNRNIPFSGFVQAFRDLMGQLLSESDTQLQAWKTKILAALGESAQVIIEVIPELERIAGQHPPAPELSGAAAQNRFNLLFQKFILVFTTPEHPLVLFLDDLQWADSASLNLIKLLMEDSETGYLLLIGAYRDNEVFAAHPLMLMLNAIGKAGATVNTITLQPLSQENVNYLVADTLHCAEELAQPLTELILQKTQGNPFFATQFLKALHQDELLVFDAKAGYWQCDLIRVREAALTEDIVEFMAVQLQKLPPATQKVLKLAACIGNQFDLATLAIVSEQSQVEAATALWKALQEGLIIPQNQVYKFYLGNEQQDVRTASGELNHPQIITYRFLHDRVQQAAYSLIPEHQKQATHYQIGKLLLENLSTAERDDRIFDVANQINIGKPLIQDESEKKQLAELNLSAGQKAKASTAYEAAKAYLQVGISLLVNDAWTAAYRLAFELHFNLAEAALMSGDFQSLEDTISILLEFANSNIDRAKIYVLRVAEYSLQGQFAESIQAGLEGLRSLGIPINRDTLKALAQEEFAAVAESLQNRAIATLLDLPAAPNPEVRAAIELLIILQPPAYIVSDFDLYSFSTFRAVRLSIEQGNTAESIKAYATYGFLIGLMHGQYQRGLEFADLALQLSYKLNSRFQQSGACFMLGCCIQVWAKPIQGAAEINYQGFLAGLESGEVPHAGYNLYSNICNRLFQGENLADIALDIDKFWLIGEKLKHDFLLSILAACRFFVHQLSQSLEQQEETRVMAEQAWVERYEALQSHTALGTYYILQMHRACLIPGVNPDTHYLIGAGKSLNGCAGFTTSAGYYYYGSLILLNYYLNLPEVEQSEVLQQIETNQAQLKIWSESCSENFLHKYLLVEAERSRFAGKFLEALELYDRAIAEAKANNYIQEEALANELAAKFYLDWDKPRVAAGYLQEAYYCYARWGAKAKTDDLENRYPHFLRSILQPAVPTLNPLETLVSIAAPQVSIHSATTTNRSSSMGINSILDFAAIFKASQSLSSTIQLDELLHQLTQIILQNSGGDRCALILPNSQGQWHLQAIATSEETQLCSVPLENHPDLPVKLIQYVKNLQQVVVIDDLKTKLPILDEYLMQRQPKSILCLPILNQGKLLGILYLNNQLVSGAFTHEHILILNVLCTQAAIALENARLYQESQVHAQQVEQALEQQKILFNVVTQMRESLDLETIFQTVTQNIRQILNVDRVGIYQFYPGQNYEYGEFIAEDVRPEFPTALGIKVQDHCFGEDYATLYKQGRICTISDVQSPEVPECHRTVLVQFEIRASLVVPILQDDELWGLLCIHQCDRSRHWQPAECQFAQQVAAQMGIALKQTELLLKTRRQATQLEKALRDLQQTELQLVQNEKMASLGNLVAGVAHEINNPLGFLNGSINNTQDYVKDLLGYLTLYQQHHPDAALPVQDRARAIDLEFLCEDLPKLLDSMKGATDRIKSISTSLRTFSRADTEHKVSANLHEGLDSTLLILKYRLKANKHRPEIKVIQDYGELPPIECFLGQLNQVFLNILANAIDVFDEAAQQLSFSELSAKPQEITIKTAWISEHNAVEIRIRDNGKGMTEEVKARTFDYLFTTKEVGKGTGLGLAIARQIVIETHAGSLEVQSELGQGTEFCIRLPISC